MSAVIRVVTFLTVALLGSPDVRAAQTVPLAMEPLFELNPTSTADLAAQTRRFPSADREALLAASASVLQDMGFKITGSNRSFGLLVGEKVADVPRASVAHAVAEAALVTATLLLSVLLGEDVVTDLPEQVEQHIHVSLHLRAAPGTSARYSDIRISIDRDMIYDDGSQLPDHTELPSIYQEFFAKLSKSIYLEAALP